MTSSLSITHPESIETKLGLLSWLSRTGAACSGDIRKALESGGHRGFNPPDLASTIRTSWSGVQWIRSGKPIFRLEDDLLRVLLKTKVPMDIVDYIPEMPFDGLYIALGEETYSLQDPTTGLHKAEGIYVCRDLIRSSFNASTGQKDQSGIAHGILVVAVGENKGKSSHPLERDDTLQYFALIPKLPLKTLTEAASAGFKETLRVVMNLLLLMSSEKQAISRKEVIPKSPKSPKKIKRAQRRGNSFHKYYSLGLSDQIKQKIREKTKKSSIKNWDGPTHVVVVVGHWHKYWVLNPGDRKVLGYKAKGKVTYSLIRKWVYPYPAVRRGAGPRRNVYKVKK